MKWVYTFEEGSKEKRDLLGGKGANLAEMTKHGLPVPPGFIITTQACNEYLARGEVLPDGLWEQVQDAIHALEVKVGRTFAAPVAWPLTVSVRSGAAVSMPGMLETILNIGLTRETTSRLAEVASQADFAHSSFQRLVYLLGKVAYGTTLSRTCAETPVLLDEFASRTGRPFPLDPYVQLRESIEAVFRSWQSSKAREYRETFHVAHDLGTAVVVQTMVFGNRDAESGTGVVFSRDPASGEKYLYGEYLPQAQGEDLVSGSSTPLKIAALHETIPEIYTQLAEICQHLEQVYRDMQDVEFTVEQGKLWILQTRAARRTPVSTIKIAVDMANEGLLSRGEALNRVEPALISQVLSSRLEDASVEKAATEGIASSPGAAVGRVALTRAQVTQLVQADEPIIFVRESISPDDVPVMTMITGILTREGGATSHAAVVARGLNKPCVVGCGDLHIDLEQNLIRINDTVVHQGDYMAIDGTTGLVFAEKKRLLKSNLHNFPELETLLTWADAEVQQKPAVFVNANSPAEIEAVLAAYGEVAAIGLCETEWMFYDTPFRSLFGAAILTDSRQKREEALARLQERQAEAFEALFTRAGGRPLYVRLLSAPLDNFLPVQESIVTELAELRQRQEWNHEIGQKERLLQAIAAHHQVNPRFGLRGMRLFIVRPELLRMQAEALFSGASRAFKQTQTQPDIRILLPLVSAAGEIPPVALTIREAARSVQERQGLTLALAYKLGALIETPRAALTIEEIVPLVDFACIGTDGLTETTLGYAREESNSFIPVYTSEQILPDPFVWFDQAGVGALIRRAGRQSYQFRQAHPEFNMGVVGVHAWHAGALHLYRELGFNSISVNPAHWLAARLAAAQTGQDHV